MGRHVAVSRDNRGRITETLARVAVVQIALNAWVIVFLMGDVNIYLECGTQVSIPAFIRSEYSRSLGAVRPAFRVPLSKKFLRRTPIVRGSAFPNLDQCRFALELGLLIGRGEVSIRLFASLGARKPLFECTVADSHLPTSNRWKIAGGYRSDDCTANLHGKLACGTSGSSAWGFPSR
jgi:hypothetical protein